MRLSLSLHCMFFIWQYSCIMDRHSNFYILYHALFIIQATRSRLRIGHFKLTIIFREMTEPYLPEAVGEQGAITIFKIAIIYIWYAITGHLFVLLFIRIWHTHGFIYSLQYSTEVLLICFATHIPWTTILFLN